MAQSLPARQGIRPNAIMGVGLWALLWFGYNTNPWILADSDFPHHSNLELIHGLRAYAPLLAGWIAFMVILARVDRLSRWAFGPVGLMLFYGVLGLASSMTVSIQPVDATYWGGAYTSIALVVMAIALVDDPLPDLKRVLDFTWIVGTAFTLSLLGLIPYMGRGVVMENEVAGVSVHAYTGAGEILGMSSTRNTGFARYAAISALVALARIWEGNRIARIIWAGVLAASVYALVISNGRTEVISFVAAAFAVMIVRRSKRAIFIILGAASAVLLGFSGFYGGFFNYITRTGRVDVSMTGRTTTWASGLEIFWHSPIWGLGFQADRYYLQGQHMHNAFLHVLVQSGILGGGAILVGLVIVCHLTIKYFYLQPPRDKLLIPPEIPGVLLFVIISSVAESTFAYFSAAWLLSAPIFAYVVALDRKMRKSRALAVWAKAQGTREARRISRERLPAGGTESAP